MEQINNIQRHRQAVRDNIMKSFGADFSDVLKAEENDLEKAHKVGDVHPNGKWVWKEYAPGKFDWRGIKGGSPSSGASAAPVQTNGVSLVDKMLKNGTLKFRHDTPTKETWYEGTMNGKKVRILQEKVGKNDWWNVEIDGGLVRTDNGRGMSFQSVEDAVDELAEMTKPGATPYRQTAQTAAPAQTKSNQSKSSGTYVPKGGSFSDMSAAEARKNLVGRTIKIGDKTAKIVDIRTWKNSKGEKNVQITATADDDFLNKTIYLGLDKLDKKETEFDSKYFGPKGQSIEVSDEEPEKKEVTKESYNEFIDYVLKNGKNKDNPEFLNKEHMFMFTVPPKYRSSKGNIHNAVAETIKKLSEVNNW